MKKIYILILALACSQVLLAQCNSAVAEYPFSGNANDNSGNNLNGTVSGASLVQDRFGTPNSAYHFDGVNDYIQVAHNALLNFGPNDDFSISLWVKPEVTQNSTDPVTDLITKWVDNGSGNAAYPFSIRFSTAFSAQTNGAVGVHRYDQSCSNHYYEYANSTPINDNQWHHVVMVKDGDSIRTYVDNVQEFVGYDITSCATSNSEPMYIGNRGGTFNQPDFFGAIDDIGIYDCALSPTEIGNIFTSLDEVIEDDDMSIIYPNPGNELNIRTEQQVNSISVIDITGKEMIRLNVAQQENNYTIKSEGWAKGVYLVRLYSDKGVVVKKWIKE